MGTGLVLLAISPLLLLQPFGANGRVFYAAVDGSDANAGSAAAPLRTLCACVGALREAGDECRLRSGRYEVGQQTCRMAGLKGTREQPVVVTAAGDGPVLVDGTLPITGPWRRERSSGLYAAAAPARPPRGPDSSSGGPASSSDAPPRMPMSTAGRPCVGVRGITLGL